MNDSIMRKHIYMGSAASARIMTIPQTCRDLDIYLWEFAEIIGVAYSTLRNYIKGRSNPPLRLYLEIGELLGWDLSRDANYIFINKLIPSDELIRRVCRAFNYADSWHAIMSMSKYMGLSYSEIVRCLTYHNRIRLSSLGLCLNTIRNIEVLKGVDDPLPVER